MSFRLNVEGLQVMMNAFSLSVVYLSLCEYELFFKTMNNLNVDVVDLAIHISLFVVVVIPDCLTESSNNHHVIILQAYLGIHYLQCKLLQINKQTHHCGFISMVLE